MHWSPLHNNEHHCHDPAPVPGKRQRGPMAFTTMLSTSPITGGEHHAPMRCLRRRTGAARTCPPPSTSKASTGSAARITAVITSSRPWWLPASSPRSRLAPDRQWPCHGKCPPASTTGPAITDQGYALERYLVPARADSPAPNAKGKTPCDIGGNSVERTLPLLCSQHRSVLHIRRTTSFMCWSLSA